MVQAVINIALLLLFLFTPVTTLADGPYAGKKILYVDSYHAGYAWSDGIAAGILAVLKGSGVEWKRAEMDTKRHTSVEFKQAAAQRMREQIAAFKPDVVIASDDNASKYLIMPYYKNAKLPFVFCGVNWDTTAYGFPYENVTGMVELDLTSQIIKQLKKYARGDRIGFMGDETLTSRKNYRYHRQLLGINYDRSAFPKTFTEWQQEYREMQDQVDMLVISNYVGITDWNDEKAQDFIIKTTKIPSGTNNTWTMPYALLGIIKKPEEQGRWAAQAALKILDGIPPNKIPITHNRQGKLYFNLRIGKILGIAKAPSGANVLE